MRILLLEDARSTRAEVTDVSTAIAEGTDAVMLSQETATGNNPVNVARTMASIIFEAEHCGRLDSERYRQLLEEEQGNPVLTAAAGFRSTKATLLLDPEETLYPVLSR
ncbi:pyruvate kinase [Desulfopila sp. IMCC35008]|uniref:pyruvate kinase n=1 Tax=Desulfopila sp. IMCC35008 TaxID=2653858 RepID=UPI0013D8C6E9|nr:pyruvate kinase [Desulfopila sp. IMCC35008]